MITKSLSLIAAIGALSLAPLTPAAAAVDSDSDLSIKALKSESKDWATRLQSTEASILKAGSPDSSVTAEAVNSPLDEKAAEWAKLIRDSIYSEGHTMKNVTVDVEPVTSQKSDASKVEFIVKRHWTEVDNRTGKEIDVDDGDVYAASVNALSSDSNTITPRISVMMVEGGDPETSDDEALPASSESSTDRSAASSTDDDLS